MVRIMALGVVLCVVFGVMKRDVMIIAANAISRFLMVSRLYFKLRRG
jgi:hypothetical protein